MNRRVFAALNGRDMPAELFKKWAMSAEITIAADGGANLLLEAGVAPVAVVGDLDSFRDAKGSSAAKMIKIEDQNYTDCEKLLQYALAQGLFPLTLGAIEGDRLDHLLGTVSAVAKQEFRSGTTLALRQGLGWVLGPGRHSCRASRGRLVSLIPLSRCRPVRSNGLKWEIKGRTIAAGRFFSVSNVALEDRFEVEFDQGLLLAISSFQERELPIW